MHNVKEVTVFAAQVKPRHRCFLWSASEKTWWNGNSNKPQGLWKVQHLKRLTCSSVALHTQYFLRQHHFRMVYWRNMEIPLPRHTWGQDDSHQYHVGRKPSLYLQLFLRGMAQIIWYLHRKRKSILTELLTLITEEQRNMSQTWGHSLLQLTENRGTLIHKGSELAEFARTLEMGPFHITHEFGMNGNSSCPCCREYSKPGNSRCSRLQAILDDHVKIGPDTEIDVFEYATASVLEVQVPSRQPRNVKSWVRILRGIDQYVRQFIPGCTTQRQC